MIGLKKEITPRVLFHDERMAEPRGDGTNIPPNPVGNRTAGERGKGKFSLIGEGQQEGRFRKIERKALKKNKRQKVVIA